jgi:hypothetical protein
MKRSFPRRVHQVRLYSGHNCFRREFSRAMALEQHATEPVQPAIPVAAADVFRKILAKFRPA